MLKRVTLVVVVVMALSSTVASAMDRAELPGVVARIAAVTHRPFNVTVVQDDDYNAWTDSVGNVNITSAFLEKLTLDQAAFVLGHEFTHVVEKHAVKQLRATFWGALGAAVVGYLVGVRGEDLGTVAQVGGSLNGAHQSRKNEYESDTEGLAYSVEAGYRAEGGPEAMRILEQRYGRGGAGIPIEGSFASHPDTHNRVLNLEKVAAKLAKERPAVASPMETEPTVSWRKPALVTDIPVPQQKQLPVPTVTTPEVPTAPVTPEAEPVNVPSLEMPSGAAVKDPGQRFRFGDIVSHALKGNETLSVESAPTGTSKVTFRLLGADGNLVMRGETSIVNPALVTLDIEKLRSFGSRLQLEVIAFDATGLELDRTTITVVVQQ